MSLWSGGKIFENSRLSKGECMGMCVWGLLCSQAQSLHIRTDVIKPN